MTGQLMPAIDAGAAMPSDRKDVFPRNDAMTRCTRWARVWAEVPGTAANSYCRLCCKQATAWWPHRSVSACPQSADKEAIIGIIQLTRPISAGMTMQRKRNQLVIELRLEYLLARLKRPHRISMASRPPAIGIADENHRYGVPISLWLAAAASDASPCGWPCAWERRCRLADGLLRME